MKLQAEIDGKKVELEVNREGDRVRAVVDGRKYDLHVSQPEKGVYVYTGDGPVYEVFVSGSARGKPVTVTSRGIDHDVTIIDPKRLRKVGSGSDSVDGVAEIKTAMPGKVVRIVSAVGDAVEKGDSVMIVEAMKMQNELKAPKAGVISSIKVSEGDTVAGGQVLATLE